MPNTLPTGIVVPCFTVAGPLQIWGGTGAGSPAAMEFLGWTRGGLEIQEQSFEAELKSDLSGGEQGPFADMQYLGEVHSLTAELTQYNPAILAKYARRVNASVATRTKGMLIGCSGGYFRVLFLSANFARNYTKVFINDPISYAPIGTPATFPRLTFTGLEDTSIADNMPWTSSFTVSGSIVT